MADIDAGVLRLVADASIHVGEQAVVHNEAEVRGDVAGLLETLAPQGPYAYMLMPDFREDGSVGLPIQTTRDEVRDIYTVVRGRSDVLSEEPIVEVRTTWYAFWESVSSGRVKATGDLHENPLAILSPAGTEPGITGEIIWPQLASHRFGTGPQATVGEGVFRTRRDLRNQHIRHLQCLENGDVEGLLSGFDDGGAAAIRDYVDDTGELVELSGKDALRSHWLAFFDKYEVVSVDLLHRVAQDWYLFAEVRITVRPRSSAGGGTVAFHTAEIHAPAKDGRILACMGWGTTPG